MTHDELVIAAATWLRRQKCHVVLQDVKSWATREQPDAIGWKGSQRGSILIECKASRSDYNRDDGKSFRHDPALGMGEYRYYMMPSGLVPPWQIRKGWGLLEVLVDGRVRVTQKSERFTVRSEKDEINLLVDALRRATEGWGRQMFGADAPMGPNGDAHPRPAKIIRDLATENRTLRAKVSQLQTDARASVAASGGKQ